MLVLYIIKILIAIPRERKKGVFQKLNFQNQKLSYRAKFEDQIFQKTGGPSAFLNFGTSEKQFLIIGASKNIVEKCSPPGGLRTVS